MPRRKSEPHERMCQISVCVPVAMLDKLSALGLTWYKAWVRKGDPFPPSHHSIPLGLRRAVALAAPLLDDAIARVNASYVELKAQHDATAAKWNANAPRRFKELCRRDDRAEEYT